MDIPERLAGALADRYRLERELGAGGMATVYLAHDIRHNRNVALKVLKPELAAVLGAERFITEIRTTAALQHPHILPLFDSGEADGFLFYVMPFIDGETLRAKLDRERQLGIDEALRITREVADALDYAHRHGVIHRDIKPENILLHDGRPVVADFGIALAVSAAAGGRMTETGLSLGTPHYMSPEQATAEREITARSDIYSLGCVLYEMLTGNPPHTGATVQQIIVKIITDAPRPVAELRRSVPAHVAAAVATSLEKLPADRFESAKAFADAFGNPAYRGTTTVPAARSAQFVPWWRKATVPVLAVSVLLLAAALSLRPGARLADDYPTVRARIDIGDLVLGNPGEIVISPDGRTLALVAQRADGTWGLYVRRIDEEDFHLLTASGSPFGPRFSPDGAWLVFHDSPDRGVKRIAVAGGAVQTLVPGSGVENIDLDWARDGTILIGSARGLRRIPATGGPPTMIREGEFFHAQALPGGGVLYSNVLGGAAVRYLPPDGSEPIDVVAGATVGRFVDAAGGVLLYTDEAGTLWALPFDARRGRSRGVAVQVADGISEATTGPRFSVSHGGTLVYARGHTASEAQRFELRVVYLDGRESPLPLTPRRFSQPRWSPQGDQLAFTVYDGSGRSQLFTYDVRLGTAPRGLTHEASVGFPVWSPDGGSIAFTISAGGWGDRSDLAIVSVAGEGAARIVRRASGTQSAVLPQHWTRENHLVFEASEEAAGGRFSVWRMDPADSTSATPYLTTEVSVRRPRVSPQSDLVAYISEQRVFVRSFPQPGPPLPASSQNGHAPAWSPDGDRLYFWKSVFTQPGATPVPDSLFVATVRRQPALSVDPPRFVLEGFFGGRPDWDLHPDGDRFVIRRRVGAEQGTTTAAVPRYFIATNWFRELEAALAAVRKP